MSSSLSVFYNVNPYTPLNWPRWESQLSQTQRHTLHTLRHALSETLHHKGIHCHFVALPFDKEEECYWVDLPWDVVQERYEKDAIHDYLQIPFLIVVLRLNEEGDLYLHKGRLSLQHNLPTPQDKTTVYALFNTAFGTKLNWDQTDRQTIALKL